MLVRAFVDPLANRLEHTSLNLNSLVSDSRVVEGPKDIVDNLVNRHSGILPSIKNSAAFC